MRRLTRKIGLFGGPAAMISSTGVIKKPSVQASGSTPAPHEEEKPVETPVSEEPKRKTWLQRIFGGR